MDSTDVIQAAFDDYVLAENLAMLIFVNKINLDKSDILKCQDMFHKWVFYFENKSKEPKNKGQKQNYQYLRNKFLKYYRALI